MTSLDLPSYAGTVAQADEPVFLTAEWRNLVVLNYEIAPDALSPYVPIGTELDLWRGRTLVSLVGFEFLKTKVWGVGVPLHRNFVEVNLRFYVRRFIHGEWRRGVSFIRELVPRRAVAWIARLFYGENYLTVAMRHRLKTAAPGGEECQRAVYGWKHAGRLGSLAIRTAGAGSFAQNQTLDEFIIEHYWGYSGGQDRPTIEYRVDHPRWRLWSATQARFRGGAAQLYGKSFARVLAGKPVSAFLADGSPVTVYRGRPIA